MNIELFKKEIERYLKQIDITINEEQSNQFHEYMKLLIEWNNKINLTAIVEENEIIIKHFVDSLTINKFINKNTTLIDVGTGAGFPGIPLKILRPDLNITLLDSLNKRTKFLNEVKNRLNLERIEIIHGRAEDIGKNKKYREKFDYATSRAVANISTLSEYLLPLVKKDGKCIYMKGSDVKEELEKGKKSINVLGGDIYKKEEFYLPGTDIKRNVIIIEKKEITPSKYPRKAGTPSKEPIN